MPSQLALKTYSEARALYESPDEAETATRNALVLVGRMPEPQASQEAADARRIVEREEAEGN